LKNVVIPASVRTVEKEAFMGCPLSTVTFADPNGWYVTQTKNASSGTNVTLTSASTAASYLKLTYLKYYWYKK
jgi:ribosomal protein L2